MSIIYILTNESMPGIIKIGTTDNLEQRIKGLDNTNIPLPFECVYAVDVKDSEKAKKIEQKLHRGLNASRVRKSREFFDTNPEDAQSLLEIAEIMGGTDVTPKNDIFEEPSDRRAVEKAKKRRGDFNFQMLGIEEGTTLYFYNDPTITSTVSNIEKTKLLFRDKETSLTGAAKNILIEIDSTHQGKQPKDMTISGPKSWTLQPDGHTLDELRTKRGLE